MTGRSDLVDLEVYVRRETDAAWGIADPDTPGNIIWLPKACCEIEGGEPPTKVATLTAPLWLLTEKGLV